MIDPKNNLSYYPNLEGLFNRLDPSIKGNLAFSHIEEQLTWAFNDLEQKRTIHRLNCVIKSILSNDVSYIQKLSPALKQALIALILLDGCKNAHESIEAYLNMGFTPLKDGVSSLFDMLKNAPQIFPIYNHLSEDAKEAIKNDFFYLHLRHLQLGEVPLSSVPKESLARPRELMVAFWYANATGFNIGNEAYPIGENTGATITASQSVQFLKLIEAMQSKNLLDYYANDSIFEGRPNFKSQCNAETVGFICRLGKMISFLGLKEDNKDYLNFVYDYIDALRAFSELESKTFSENKIEAVTFLPKLLHQMSLCNTDKKSLDEILSTFLSLQRQLYLSVPSLIATLGNNRTIPLFSLSSGEQNDMLKKFIHSADKSQFHFEATVNEFLVIKLVDGPVPELEKGSGNKLNSSF